MFEARSPVVALFGSSFPVWLFASIAGIVVALFLRQILIYAGISRDLPWPALFHPSIALLSGVAIYVLWIGGYA